MRRYKRRVPITKTQTRTGLYPLTWTTCFTQTKASLLTLLHQKLTIWSIRLSMASPVFVQTTELNQFSQMASFRRSTANTWPSSDKQRWMGGSWRGWTNSLASSNAVGPTAWTVLSCFRVFIQKCDSVDRKQTLLLFLLLIYNVFVHNHIPVTHAQIQKGWVSNLSHVAEEPIITWFSLSGLLTKNLTYTMTCFSLQDGRGYFTMKHK